ncbi:hypothetical protein [Brevundimonas sp.]|uniref:hypothetical protein n=1 Tax=Brevundimonas sp. TaxID=1871086 RepID=UPI002FCB67CC
MSASDKSMDMIDTYLGVVAAQLPKDKAEDIVAELRDEILARKEDREEALGRELHEAELEVMLREVGHPLVVAARYSDRPQGLIGPELYPWWMFAARLGVIALALLALARLILSVLFGGEELGRALGHAVSGFMNGAISVAGVLAIAGWVIERQPKKPEFLTDWKVRDLGLFAWAGTMERSGLDFLRGNVVSRNKAKGTPVADRSDFSPVAGAATSAVFTLIVLLWWIGALGGVRIDPLRLLDGYDLGAALREVHRAIYWPVAAVLAARVVFDGLRVVTGSPVKLTAAGDLVFALANMGILAWIWTASPLSELIRVGSANDFWQQMLSRDSWAMNPVPTLLMGIVVFGFICEAVRAVQSLASLVLDRKIGRNH